MAFTVLDVVNKSLKRVGIITGESGELTTSTQSTATGLDPSPFVDSERQHYIDVMLQTWQEAVHEIYFGGMLPLEVSTATLTLASGEREYDLPTDFDRMAGDSYYARALRGVTNGVILFQYPGGYAQMLADQPVATDWVGDPQAWALSPNGDKIRLDRDGPTGTDNTDTYNFLYEKRVAFTSTMATESLPFSDSVADSMVPVVAEFWGRALNNEFDAAMFTTSISRAIGVARRTQPQSHYGRGRRDGFTRRF